MGIKNLPTPYIRDSPTSLNSTLSDVLTTSKNVVALDMSTIFVTAIKGS